MEKRLKDNIEEILLRYPGIDKIEFHACKGLKTDFKSTDYILDILGFDAQLILKNKQRLTVQVKVGTLGNFRDWGHPRGSLVLGDANDIDVQRVIDTHINSCDLILSGYETEPGIVRPFALFSRELLLKRFIGNRIHVTFELNKATGKRFAWITYNDLKNANIIIEDIYDFEYFGTGKCP